MATKEEKIKLARHERMCRIVNWMNGGPRGHEVDPRWDGDDGRIVEDQEIMWMRIKLLEGGLDSDTQAKYQKIVNAEQAEFERVDALYETEKANATDD